MKLILRNCYGGRSYVLMPQDAMGDYCDLTALSSFEPLYDYHTGNPVNAKVQEMDDCIYKKWNPSRFMELLHELLPNTELRDIT